MFTLAVSLFLSLLAPSHDKFVNFNQNFLNRCRSIRLACFSNCSLACFICQRVSKPTTATTINDNVGAIKKVVRNYCQVLISNSPSTTILRFNLLLVSSFLFPFMACVDSHLSLPFVLSTNKRESENEEESPRAQIY